MKCMPQGPRANQAKGAAGAAGLALALSLAACQSAPPERVERPVRPVVLVPNACPPVQYPPAARQAQAEARVLLQGRVAIDGSVGEVVVLESAATNITVPGKGQGKDQGKDEALAALAKALDEAAVRMLGQCRFAPVGDGFAPAQVRLPVRFALQPPG